MPSLDKAINIEDLRQMALKRLPDFVSAYVERGAGDGGGVRRNIDAFRKHLLVPRGLVDVRGIDTGTEIFGQQYASFFGISPVGTSGIYRRNADIFLAEAAAAANVPFILSGAATSSVADVTRAAPNHTWYQLYAAKEVKVTDRMIGRARDAGIKVMVYTVDYPIVLRSEVIARTGVSLATGPTLGAWPRLILDALRHPAWTIEYLANGGLPKLESWTEFAPAEYSATQLARYYSERWNSNQTWADLDRIRKQWDGPLVVKGLVHPGDVARAIEAGANAVTVSNHGGNKLDCMQGCLDAFAAIRLAAGKNVTLFFDGGIRRGSDIVIAKALGANFCFTGRATLYGVTAGGHAGAQRALSLLQTELEYTMAMIGCRTVAEITADYLAPVQ